MLGRFISVEGVEGAGKSTLLGAVEAHLKAAGDEVVMLREPGGTKIGDQIRELLLDKERGALAPRAELLLFLASRAQLVDEIIGPALNRGAMVLCDRFVDSSVAYQGAARGLGVEAVIDLNGFATKALTPELTLLVDLPAEVGLERARQRRGAGVDDRFEGEALRFHTRVRQAFLELADREPNRFRVLDGTLPKEALAQAAVGAIQGRWP